MLCRAMLRHVMLAAFLGCSTPGFAADRAIIVLDASGSMWGQIDGKAKLDIARTALGGVVRAMPATTELGLIAYGHREKGNCADIELVVPPAAGSGARIADIANRLRFLGKTPLSEAVRQAAISLRHTEEKATVILITDGIETCGADPCALAAELEKTGVDFTTHVVGFGLSREEGRQVACLAENTGGRYIRAGNEAELRDALQKTVASASAPTKKPEPVTLPKASVATRAKPTIGQSFAVDWTGPGGANDYIDIMPVASKIIGSELSYAYVQPGKPLSLRAPGKPGAYDIRYIWEGPDKRHILASARIEVGDTQNALVAPARVIAGTAFEVEWKGPGQPGDFIGLFRPDRKQLDGELSYFYVDHGNPGKMKAPGDAGSYELRYILDAPDGRKMLARTSIEVMPATATLAFPPSAMAGTEITVNWKGPAAEGDYLDLVPAGRRQADGEIAYAYFQHSPDGETIAITMPGDAGAYEIRYILEAAGGRRILARVPITVTAATATLQAPPEAARGKPFAIDWTGPRAKGDFIAIAPAGRATPDGEVAYAYVDRAEEKGLELTAPETPGSYEIRYILEAPGGRRILARIPLTIR